MTPAHEPEVHASSERRRQRTARISAMIRDGYSPQDAQLVVDHCLGAEIPARSLEKFLSEIGVSARSAPKGAATKPVAELFGRDAVSYLADVIASERWQFDMGLGYAATCGTPGCIMGHAAAIWPECHAGTSAFAEGWFDTEGCMARLSLSHEQFNALCYPPTYGGALIARGGTLDRPNVVATLRHYVSTGNIVWNAQDREGEQS